MDAHHAGGSPVGLRPAGPDDPYLPDFAAFRAARERFLRTQAGLQVVPRPDAGTRAIAASAPRRCAPASAPVTRERPAA